jgi:hypothetical protein
VEEATMIPTELIGPYIGSNLVALLLILIAALWPKIARYAFGVIFFASGCFNAYTALTQPHVYVTYGEMAVLEVYRDFIYGIFSERTAAFILPIAAGQLAIGVMLFIGRGLALRLGVLGAAVFLTAIAPLGVGSAFPFSALAIIALIVMLRRLSRPTNERPDGEAMA